MEESVNMTSVFINSTATSLSSEFVNSSGNFDTHKYENVSRVPDLVIEGVLIPVLAVPGILGKITIYLCLLLAFHILFITL